MQRRNQVVPAFMQRLKERQNKLRERQEQRDTQWLDEQQAEPKVGRLHAFADWLDDWHVTRIFQSFGAFLLVLTLVSFAIDYQDRKDERLARKEARTVAAWQLLTARVSGNSGKKQALEFLHSQGHALIGIDFSPPAGVDVGAYLMNLNAKNVYMPDANFSYANLMNSNFSDAALFGANFSNANLKGAEFQRANLMKTNFHGALLYSVNFQNADMSFVSLNGAIFGHVFTPAYNEKGNLVIVNEEIGNLIGVKGMTCKALKRAINWEATLRDKELACGKPIPELPKELALVN